MFPDLFDISDLGDLTQLNSLLLTAAPFVDDPNVTDAFSVDAQQVTVGDYLSLLDQAENSLLATDFSFLLPQIDNIRTLLDQNLTEDAIPDNLTKQQVIDQSIGVLEDFANGDLSLITDGFDAIRAVLDGVPDSTLLAEAFVADLPDDPTDPTDPTDDDIDDLIDDFLENLPQLPTGTNPAWVSGDPHLRTLDGVNYDFQAAGEFVLLKSTDDQGFELQSRMAPAGENVSVNEAVATNLDGTAVMIDSTENDPLYVDGSVVTMDDGGSTDVGNGRIYRSGDTYTIVYPGADGQVGDGDSQVVVRVRDGRLDIDVRLNDALMGALEGLLGDGDGNPDNDIARADGTALARPLEFAELYGGYRDDWRVDSTAESLFTYDSGESPDDFYQSDFPGELISLDTLDTETREAAEQAARDAGLQDGTEAFDNAVLDFALTDDPSFLDSALDTPISAVGTPQADTLLGNAGDDVLSGEGGNDRLEGLAGNDILDGGAGNDGLLGGVGNDVIDGGAGDDTISSFDGNDVASGGDGDDRMGGGLGDDDMRGDAGDDFMGGGRGNDAVDGGADNDVVNGGAGDDTLDGGTGSDTMGGSFNNDVVNGGDGDDDMGGGAGQDTVDAGAGNDSVGGGEGNDEIAGGDGDDFLAGGGRDDVIDGGAGNDSINGGDGDDTMTGGDGEDLFVFNFFKDGDADVITDFEDGTDGFLIRTVSTLDGTPNIDNGGNGVQGFLDALNITDTADGAQMTVDGHIVTIENVAAADLTLDDFQFI
ncbi:VWD domain-containing protein [Roseovarius sp. SYSU LYC5161]|uniref:VWD domain-containing protein n=1 Tax=Roseovarius halophilus (ex Wu et al. 2025) TaxID=3376060 RepID=UPI00399AE7A0